MIERSNRSWRKFLLAGFALVVLGAFGVDKEEFSCEQATAHLAECCPGFDARTIICGGNGCGGSGGYVDLNQARSECILGASCEDLVSSGACGSPRKVLCD